MIGASGTPSKIGGMPIAHLKRFGYAGPIYPVNPGIGEAMGKVKNRICVRLVSAEICNKERRQEVAKSISRQKIQG